jgi:hypothetical protein
MSCGLVLELAAGNAMLMKSVWMNRSVSATYFIIPLPLKLPAKSIPRESYLRRVRAPVHISLWTQNELNCREKEMSKTFPFWHRAQALVECPKKIVADQVSREGVRDIHG